MFVGICAAIVMGIVHHYALSGILKFSPQRSDGSGFRIILTFSALLLLHVLELVTLAVFNTMVVASVLPQSFSNSPDVSGCSLCYGHLVLDPWLFVHRGGRALSTVADAAIAFGLHVADLVSDVSLLSLPASLAEGER